MSEKFAPVLEVKQSQQETASYEELIHGVESILDPKNPNFFKAYMEIQNRLKDATPEMRKTKLYQVLSGGTPDNYPDYDIADGTLSRLAEEMYKQYFPEKVS